MKDLIINEFYKGIAESPILGFGAIRNIDLYSTPGVIQPNYKTTKVSGSVVTGLVKWFATNPTNGDIFALDTGGVVYKSTNNGGTWTEVTGNTKTNATGEGLAIWKDYLVVARSTVVDVYGPLSGSPAWTNSFKTDLTAVDLANFNEATHPMLVGQDDILYIGNQRYIASLTQLTTFDPASAPTYTWTAQALDLPSGYKVRCLAELGTNLMIGTWRGNAITDVQVADIFPWDRTSSSFGLPIRLSEYGVHQMLNMNNLLYIVAGSTGSVYVSNGTSTRLLRQLPVDISLLQGGNSAEFFPGAIFQNNGRIFFGVSTGTNTAAEIVGVWSVTPNGTLTFEHQISTGTISAATTVSIGALIGIGGKYCIGWRDASTYGIDQTDTTRFTTYLSAVQTPLYRVGTPLQPMPFSQIDMIFDKPLASGDGLKIKYRDDLSSAFTTLGTYDFATYGAVDYLNVPFPSPAFVNIQLQLEPTQNARLREIRIR